MSKRDTEELLQYTIKKDGEYQKQLIECIELKNDENKELKKEIERLNKENELLKSNPNFVYVMRNNKAIEYINAHKVSDTITFPLMKKDEEQQVKNCFDYEFEQIYKKDLLKILKGEDNE